MRARVSGVVVAMWQEIWRRGGVQVASPSWGALRKLKGVGSASPGWSSNLVQSMVRPSRRGGVPVFRRVSRRPSFFRDSPRRTEAGSPLRPAVYCCSPQWMRPLRKVPVVTMTACAAMRRPSRSRTPVMRGEAGDSGIGDAEQGASSSITRSMTSACLMKRLGMDSSFSRMRTR